MKNFESGEIVFWIDGSFNSIYPILNDVRQRAPSRYGGWHRHTEAFFNENKDDVDFMLEHTPTRLWRFVKYVEGIEETSFGSTYALDVVIEGPIDEEGIEVKQYVTSRTFIRSPAESTDNQRYANVEGKQ